MKSAPHRHFFKRLFGILEQITRDKNGSLLVYVMVFGSVAFTIIVSGVAGYALFENKTSNRVFNRANAFHVAEAGIEYYRWHLAHDPEDYTDGTEGPGPYIHEYKDKDGNLLGYFSLEIDPPPSGSTIVTIQSTGWTAHNSSDTRSVKASFGLSSLSDFAFLENADMRFSNTTEVHGKVHSNGGIRFDATTDALVESARETYFYQGGNSKPGIWGNGGPQEFWQFPVASKNFEAISADMAQIRDLADDGGLHLNSSGQEGWHIVFKDGGVFDLYKVSSRECYKGKGFFKWWWWTGSLNCYDILAESFVETKQIPGNGVIFVEDDIWVEGLVDGRVTVVAGRFPVLEPTYQELYINNNLTYKEKAGDDVLGLIAQGDIIVPFKVPDDMEIDAAALSQFGQIARPYYNPSYNASVKNSLLFFGSQISYGGGGWKWGDPVVSGFINTTHVYDSNLLFHTPPGFPTSGTYELLSWEEIE
ncbi:MAG: hypothetical protein HYY51_02425 [Candidatus Magasanikbacteria bacterium]|nr:hypothetical protein [Candidatus Magasanikbacteria bacterium]